MEMGSSSSPSSTCSDSLNGLKFGQKIYFEDVGIGPSAKSGGGSSSSCLAAGGSGGQPPPPTPPKKGRSGVVQAGQPPRCQVEGCQVDLSDAKAYYSRHKVCGMHSKSPKVIVGGLEQRFCQQCSRFHQLSEFDQGKRSCRRRLAGHNERRRKPPPGSSLALRYGRLASSVFESSRSGGFLMDFTTYPRATAGGDPWPIIREPDGVLGAQPTATGKFLPHPWQSESENPPPSNLFLQGSVSGTSYSAAPSYPSGECVTRASDSSCALSLLSNQPWGSRDRPSSLGANSFLNADGTLVVLQSVATTTHGTSADHFSGASSWGFKVSEAGGSSHEIPPNLGQSRTHHHQPAATDQYAGELELAQQSGRQYLELQNSQAYDSSSSDQHMHWSL